MRILVLNYEYPPLGGGAGNATYFLCREWGKLGIQTDVVTTWFTGHEPVTNESENVTIYRVRSSRRKKEQSNIFEMISYVNKGFSKAKDLCKQNKYDCVISFFGFPVGIIAYKLFKQYKLPYIVLLRGGDVPGFLPKQLGIFHTITMPYINKIWKHASRVIANSKGLAMLAQKTGNSIPVKIDTVPNGVDVDLFKPASITKHADFMFLFVGRFSEQKNLKYLIDQFELYALPAGARLTLVGDGPLKSLLTHKIESSTKLRNSISLLPWSSKEELITLYNSAHCFVNPSLFEGLPNAILEAIACGLPVIASDIGGNNELVFHGKNGYIFSIDKKDDLGKYMKEMVQLAQKEELGNYSRQLAIKNFSWQASAKQILSNAGK